MAFGVLVWLSAPVAVAQEPSALVVAAAWTCALMALLRAAVSLANWQRARPVHHSAPCHSAGPRQSCNHDVLSFCVRVHV